MANVTIRNRDDAVMQRVREQAARNHRSVEAELRQIVSDAVRPVDLEAFRTAAAAMRAETKGLPQTDSTLLIREDRDG